MPRTEGRTDAADPMDRAWTTGFYKEPVVGSVWVGRHNLDGDGQADLKNHGGPDKAVNVYPIEHYSYWKESLCLPDLSPGAFGENFTVGGILEADICIGDIIEIGGVLVQVSQPRQPCWKLARRWRVKDLAFRVQQTGRTGWYFRVLREGTVQAGSQPNLIERPCPEWTVAAANDVMHHRPDDWEAVRSLAACQLLSTRWRETLTKRVATGGVTSSSERLYGHISDP